MSLLTSRTLTRFGRRISKFGQTGKNGLPVSFASAEESIALTDIPIYNAGVLSRLPLYSDMIRLGIATLIVKGDSGAMRGLELMGWKQVTAVEEGLEMLHVTLNTFFCCESFVSGWGGRSFLYRAHFVQGGKEARKYADEIARVAEPNDEKRGVGKKEETYS